MEGILKLAYQQNPEQTVELLKEAIKSIDHTETYASDFIKNQIPKDFIDHFLYINDVVEYNGNIPIDYLRDNKDKFTKSEWESISKWIPDAWISEFERYIDSKSLYENKNISLERLRGLSSQTSEWVYISEWIPDAWIAEFKDYLDICFIITRSDISFESVMLLKDRFTVCEWDCFIRLGKPEYVEKLLDEIPFENINTCWVSTENLRIVKDKLNKQSWSSITRNISNRDLEEFKDYVDFDQLLEKSDLSGYIQNIFKDELEKAREARNLLIQKWKVNDLTR